MTDYYTARLFFTNGQKVSIPLYVPFINANSKNEAVAARIAHEIGADVARTGEISLSEWALRDKIPLRKFLRERLIQLVKRGCFKNEIQFATSITDRAQSSYSTFNVTLYDGSTLKYNGQLTLKVPSEFNSPDMVAFLNREVDTILGAEYRRNQLKSSVRVESSLSPEEIVLHVPHESVTRTSLHVNANATFTFPHDAGTLTCSLGTKDETLAGIRLGKIQEFIRRRLGEGKELKIRDILAYRDEVVDKKSESRRKTPHRGPVIAYVPKNSESEPPKEGMRLYTALFGTDATGHVMQLYAVPPYGGGHDRMYSMAFLVAPEHGLSTEDMDKLRTTVRGFFEQKLSAFFHAGGKFLDGKDIVFGPKGPAFTSQGAEKFHAILEGRLNTEFVNAALKAGFHNPFYESLSPNNVYRLGGMRPAPQPANSHIQLFNTREVSLQSGQTAMRSTLVFTGQDDRELFRCDLQFPGMDQLAALVHCIDGWTAHIRAQNAELPAHIGVSLLRKLSQPHVDPRQQNLS